MGEKIERDAMKSSSLSRLQPVFYVGSWISASRRNLFYILFRRAARLSPKILRSQFRIRLSRIRVLNA